MSEGEGSRAERLRNRRAGRQRSPPDEPGERDEPSERDESGETSKPSEPGESGEPSESSEPSVKDEQVGTYMYLPQSQKKELQRLYNVMKAEYEFEFEQEFEKNRHFYPMLVQYGLESLDGLDASEIQTRLDEL
ncbi:MAG: hypothetical protein V5A27_10925 [Halapricum sp.]